ncbi:hypothetical protein DRF65_04395 [Chryseobacterium pennae]|uniref:RNA-binding S4 domain-containing protein n=1 Tax=Chryseobacterium pennae TaxID=2258962 RepID=A0A3D9CDM6_9FLAO|nr:hypothetical protein DRF65_04395 [Chryseobacterium pennae]
MIRTCLNLSSSKLNQLIDAEAIFVHERLLQKKHKVQNGDVVRIHKDKLKTILWKEELYDEVAVK